MSDSTNLPDEVWLTLAEACERFFRGAIKPASLRAEAKRGHLTITRVGNKDFVTPAAIRAMSVRKAACPESDSLPVFTSEKMRERGSSETDRKLSAQAAAQTTAQALKKLSGATSRKSLPLPSGSIVPLSSPLTKS